MFWNIAYFEKITDYASIVFLQYFPSRVVAQPKYKTRDKTVAR